MVLYHVQLTLRNRKIFLLKSLLARIRGDQPNPESTVQTMPGEEENFHNVEWFCCKRLSRNI